MAELSGRSSGGHVILKPGHLSLPLDLAAVYDRIAPLVIEIGFGDGEHLSHLAKEHPEWDLFGVEVSMGSMWRAYRRMKREGIRNVRLFHGDARFIVRDVLAKHELHRMVVNFPDPWPRQRHIGNRLLQKTFFELASTRLEDDGTIALTTDHEEYFQFAIREATESGIFEIETGVPPEATLQTKYARKWKDESRSIFHVVFQKTGDANAQPRRIKQVDMKHALLQGDLDTITDFSKQVHTIGDIHIIVLEAFRSFVHEGILFKVLVEEPDLRQEILVEAWQKDDGVLIELQPFGDPLGTKGVREAVRAVADWLVSQGLQMKKSWI